MASSHLLCNTFPFQTSCNLSSKSNTSSFKPRGSFSFCQKVQFRRTPVVKATRKQVELVYDPDEKLNKLADEVDKQAPLSRLTLFSPCKVNVFLRITSKREDGYHDLASLFHVISLGDVIKFSLSPSKSIDRLSTNVSGVPLTEDNLIIKALNLYRKKTGTDNFFWIHLDKKELQEWSSEIGSDIPFFFSHGAAYCTGRGEIVQDIPSPVPSGIPMVLMKPPQACSTAEVYKRFQLDKTSQADPFNIAGEDLNEWNITRCYRLPYHSVPAMLMNLLPLIFLLFSDGIFIIYMLLNGFLAEPPAFEVLPSLKRLKQRIAAAGRGQYDAVFMSGKHVKTHVHYDSFSGSTIVGIGSPDPPQFIYDDDEYQDVFVSEANFLAREANKWYQQPASTTCSSPPEFSRSAE
ncbi:hypothetical protein OIU77_017203 [Salix suchowensis]|uniref:Uncharacterized protein n=1 Tax=Salix suchowensis TaxID=1278906 RepID=A0ABQ8ZNG6_9ROSI|nr:hypothetical protein OIU77_017203 [Salix suchowensis]